MCKQKSKGEGFSVVRLDSLSVEQVFQTPHSMTFTFNDLHLVSSAQMCCFHSQSRDLYASPECSIL